MSSVVKKSTHFTPKLRKKPIKRKVPGTPVEPQLTPPPTQAPEEDGKELPQVATPAVEQEEPSPSSTATQEQELVTPATTQASQPVATVPLKTFNFKVKEAQQEAEDIDPKDTSIAQPEPKTKEIPRASSPQVVPLIVEPPSTSDTSGKPHDGDAEGHSDSDNDLFKEVPRRKSSVQQLRLTGITPILNRNRSGSVSFTPDTTGGTGAPAKIGIPVAKSIKRRRSSAHARNPVKRASIIKPTAIITPKEPSPVPEENFSKPETSEVANDFGDAEFVVGIDEATNRLTKFRSRVLEKVDPSNELEIENFKIAPPDLKTTIKNISQLPRIIKDEDEFLFRDIALDVNEMTMADLCKPTLPIGKVSSNYESVKAAQLKIKERKLQRRKDREDARAERVSLEEIAARNGDFEESEEAKKKNRDELLNGDNDAGPSLSLQLTIGGDGKIGFDADSAIVSRHQRIDNSKLAREESNPFENPITSSTYSKRRHTDRWTQEEVKQFYAALSTFGTDFLLIAQLFPYRTRKQIKSKFNLEEKNYPEIVELALRRKLPADFEEYCASSKNTIKSLEFYNDELRKVRIQHEDELKKMAHEREEARKADAEATRQLEIQIRTGMKPRTKRQIQESFRKNETVVGSIDQVKQQEPEDSVIESK